MHSIFSNDLILQEIMSNLSFPELKSCQLVNRLWHSHSLKSFRAFSSINLKERGVESYIQDTRGGLDHISTYKITDKGLGYTHPLSPDFKSLLKAVEKASQRCKTLTCSEIPNRNIPFSMDRLPHHSYEEISDIWRIQVDMITKIIPLLKNVEELHLLNSTFVMDSMQNLTKVYPEMRKVKRLTLTNMNVSHLRLDHYDPGVMQPLANSEVIFATRFFKMFPSLESLIFNLRPEDYTDSSLCFAYARTINCLFCLYVHRYPDSFPNLKELKMSGHSSLIYALLTRAMSKSLLDRLKICTLNIHDSMNFIGTRELVKNVSHLVGNLEEFNLEIDIALGTGTAVDVSTDLSEFMGLKKLSITANFEFLREIANFELVREINYQQRLPQLTHLHIKIEGAIEKPDAIRIVEQFIPQEPFNLLRNLKFELCITKEEREELLARIRVGFPKVKNPVVEIIQRNLDKEREIYEMIPCKNY